MSLKDLRPAGVPLPLLQATAEHPVQPHQGFNDGAISDVPNFSRLRGMKDHTWHGLVYDDKHAKKILEEYRGLNDKPCDTDAQGSDIPRDRVSQLAIVREIYDGICDFTSIIDRPAKRKRRNTDPVEEENGSEELVPQNNHQAKRVKEAPNVVLEALSWEILVSSTGEAFLLQHTREWLTDPLLSQEATIAAHEGKINISP
jgi:hypothetical protein